MYRVLVTGCGGFIGSHLCERLLSEGCDVVGIDALTDYYDPELKRGNLERCRRHSKFEFIHNSLLHADLAAASRDVEMVYHLAAQPGVRGSWGTKFDSYVEHNLLATQKLLEALVKVGRVRRLVYASSSSVYGNTSVEQVTEDYPKRPFSPYGVTKLAAEQLCNAYAMNHGLRVVSLRFFTVYGPRQRPDMAFSRLISAGLIGETFTIYGNGRQERDFTFVQDVVDGLRRAATCAESPVVFNLGGGHVVSLCEVISRLEEILDRRIAVSAHPPQKGDVARTSADISRSRAVLGYEPKWTLASGLAEQVEWVRKTLLTGVVR